MAGIKNRFEAKNRAIHRATKSFRLPVNEKGEFKKISDYYGDNVFDFEKATEIPESIRKTIVETAKSGKKIDKDHAEVIAKVISTWAMSRGATHFCHWFQPLTGGTAEKHDSFLNFDKSGTPIDSLDGAQLLQGEPDASSFPNGGSRSTFEARGYTSWDLTSPIFLMEGANGKTLCIPTAFVSYTGEALDIKTPLLRSISAISQTATRFLNQVADRKVTNVGVNTGAEQEYFLVDKAFYYLRPDLVMTGRTLFGGLTNKNQQLSDHYFADISERVMSFMEELDYKLHRHGIPAKTRHNEVAPGQFEIAPIFTDANVAADNNQFMMAVIKKLALKHDFVALLHEKPFFKINGSGKHLNWSMSDDTGHNLLSPGNNPHENLEFLSTVSIIMEALYRHSEMLRMAIASQGNDHRLGANEAPPSIISIFLGDTLTKIYDSIYEEKDFNPSEKAILDLGANQLAHLLQDNTDRNRTSPFAFTGNKFEFRAVGSQAAIGFPLSILNSAVSEVFEEAASFIEEEKKNGADSSVAQMKLIKKLLKSSYKKIVFNGDGYSEEWVKEAEQRGLPNLRTTADALAVLKDTAKTNFLTETGVYKSSELEMRYNALLERYVMLREIEFKTLNDMVDQNVIPAALEYKNLLSDVIKKQKEIGLESNVEVDIYKRLKFALESAYSSNNNLQNALENNEDELAERSLFIANELLPLSETVAQHCNELEGLIPERYWDLPKYFDLLFVK
jgi:glutamine synthetase